MAAIKLELRDLTRDFPGTRALDRVSLTVVAGEVHALVGENGAGKSTLIKIVAGVIPQSSGTMTIDGRPHAPADPAAAIRAGVSAIHQERCLLDGRPVMFNVLAGIEPTRFPGRLDLAAMRQTCAAVLARLGAAHLDPTAPLETLTPGERQLIEIARALSRRCSLLIMDEPSSALNQAEREALFEVVASLRGQGVAVVYVSHRLEEVFRLADRVTVLRDGRVVRTAAVADTDRDRLIADMIGRGLAGAFPARTPPRDELALEVRGLSAADGAFADVTFALRAGEALGIAGLAGSGKEELARALFGDRPPRSGEIKIAGAAYRPTPAGSIARGLAFCPEDRKAEGLIGDLPLRRNLALPILGRLAGPLGLIDAGRERAVANLWVDRLGVKATSIEQPCRELSGGNQQKVALAKWLAAQARVLLLAGPTQEIDVAVKFELYQLFARLLRDGVGLVIFSTDLPELLGLCHRVLVMREGRLVADLATEATDPETLLRHALGQAPSKDANNHREAVAP